MRSFSAPIRISCIRHCEGVKRPRQSVSSALPISCKSADLPDYLLCFLLFQELRFLCLCKESSKESTRRRGERNLPALRSTPLRAESFLFRWSPAARRRRSARAPTEMFRAGNKGSVSDEEPRYAVPAMFLWLPCAKGAVARRRLKD